MGLICFDLDGTLVNPLRAMVHCADMACRDLGLAAPDAERIGSLVGFGPEEIFRDLAPPGRLDEAIAKYWLHFEDTGIALHQVYDGVPLMLTRLKRQGHSLFAVTVKPVRFARRILHEFDLLHSFDEVFGTGPGGRSLAKDDVVQALRLQGAIKPGGYLVGDRAADMASAKAHGLIPLGVTYGFGSSEELQAAGAERRFGTPAELDAWFLSRFPGSEIHDAFSLSE